jgi:single-stranded-DNA-specific exonuclease
MGSAEKSLQLLLSNDMNEALELAQSMEENNKTRQRTQKDIIEEALGIVEREVNFKDHKVIVLYQPGWHKGVLGIVASRIVERYYRPAIVISTDEGVGVGSARSIDGFHIFDALTHCSKMLVNFGGHERAAGLTLKEEHIEVFRETINAFANDVIRLEDLVPNLTIDGEIPLSELSVDLVQIVESLEPFGEGNPSPVFCSRRLTVKSPPQLMGKDTLKFWVTDGQTNIQAVGFGMGKYRELIGLNSVVDLAYQLTVDDWNKSPAVSLKLKDIHESESLT